MKDKIPLQRLIVYLLILPLLPLFLYLPSHYFSRMRELNKMELFLQKVKESSFIKEQKQAVNNAVRHVFAGASPTFLSDELETLNLLTREKEAIEKIIRLPSFPGNETLEQRYHFLREANKISFLEGSTIKKEGIEESLQTLCHSVEMDADDLKEILKIIEEKKQGSPQLLFTQFKLNKKTMPNKGEVYEINMQLLKREYLQ